MIYIATYYQIIINIQEYKNKLGVTKAEILHYNEPFIFYELDKIECNTYINLIESTLDEINKYIIEEYLIEKNKKIFINYENPKYKSFIESYNSIKSKCNKSLSELLEFINFNDEIIEKDSYSKKIQESKSKITAFFSSNLHELGTMEERIIPQIKESISKIKKDDIDKFQDAEESIKRNDSDTTLLILENDEICYDYYIFNSLTDKNEFYLINDNLTHCGCKAFEYKGKCKHLITIKNNDIQNYDKINLRTKICSCDEFHFNNNYCIHSTFEYNIV